MAMGGKVAEEMTFGPENVTSGASSDIQQITKNVRDLPAQENTIIAQSTQQLS